VTIIDDFNAILCEEDSDVGILTSRGLILTSRDDFDAALCDNEDLVETMLLDDFNEALVKFSTKHMYVNIRILMK